MNHKYLGIPQLKMDLQVKRNNNNDCIRVDPIFICFNESNQIPIPLNKVDYNVKVEGILQIIEIQQFYSTQDINDIISLEYLFALNENAAMTKMLVEIGDKQIYGIIKEKLEAQKEYDQGIKDGKTMAYCEQNEQFPQIKKVKIGQLAPQQSLKIIFEYIQPLEFFKHSYYQIELFPMVDENIFGQHFGNKTSIVKSYITQILQLDKFKYNYKQNIIIKIHSKSNINFIDSFTHQIKGVFKNEKEITITLLNDPDNQNPKNKFNLIFQTEEINQPEVILSHSNNDAFKHKKYCVSISFKPTLRQTSGNDAYFQFLQQNSNNNEIQQNSTFLFFIDRSGSMTGRRIKKAKLSLILFLKSIPENSMFNIISFGSNYTSLWQENQKYNQKNLSRAIEEIKLMEADLDGTDILTPLKQLVYNQDINNITNVFLLTDGEDSPLDIIKLIQQNNKKQIRLYTLGVGTGCNQFLIKKMAQYGNGNYQFVTDDEDINEPVISLLKDSLNQQVELCQLDCNAQNIYSIIPNPQSKLSVRKNEKIFIQILFSEEQISQNINITISWYNPLNKNFCQQPFQLNLQQSIENEYFHKYAAFQMIQIIQNSYEIQNKQINDILLSKQEVEKQDLINLSIENQILCSQTAFICEIITLSDELKQKINEKLIINKKEIIKMKEKEQYSYLQQQQSRNSYVMPQSQPNDLYSYKDVVLCCYLDSKQPTLPKYYDYREIVDLVQANGSIDITQSQYYSLKLKALKKKKGLSDILWATFLGLLYLDILCQDNQKVWQLMFQKGIQYLQSNKIDYAKLKKEYEVKFKKLFNF